MNQKVDSYTGGELVRDEALEPLELGLLLGRGDGAAVGRLRVQPAEAPVAALHHRQHVALLDCHSSVVVRSSNNPAKGVG